MGEPDLRRARPCGVIEARGRNADRPRRRLDAGAGAVRQAGGAEIDVAAAVARFEVHYAENVASAAAL